MLLSAPPHSHDQITMVHRNNAPCHAYAELCLPFRLPIIIPSLSQFSNMSRADCKRYTLTSCYRDIVDETMHVTDSGNDFVSFFLTEMTRDAFLEINIKTSFNGWHRV